MNTISQTRRKEFSWKRLIIPMVIGGVVGFTAMRLGRSHADRLVALVDPDQIAGLVVGLLSLAVALFCFVGAFFPRSVARSYGIAPGEDVSEEASLQRWSALCALFYGLFMLTLSLHHLLGTPLALALMGASLLGAIATNSYLWRRYDELWREITAQACVITFTLFHYILLAWAALAVVLDGAGFEPVNVISALLAVFTIATIRATARRGLANLP